MITFSRPAIRVLAALFSLYHVVLAFATLSVPSTPWPAVAAALLYAAATTASLIDIRAPRLPLAIALADLAVAIAVPLLCAPTLDPQVHNSFATWYIAGIGTLMTIVAVRGRALIAWIGIAFLAGQTALWAGTGALGELGVIGSLVWVAAALVVMQALRLTAEDAETFERVELAATAWRAEYDAHVVERQRRLDDIYTQAEPLLTQIVRSGGRLDDEQRAECVLLEASMRDEIRGRALLDDGVRAEVARARRRGASVTLLDEGGIDDLDALQRRRVLRALARALADSDAEQFVVRTVPRGAIAVTVVGLRAEDDVALWLEIPRDPVSLARRSADGTASDGLA